MNELRTLDLFSGVGGMSLAMERAGCKTVQFVEQDEYCREILRRHWPDVAQHDDIKTFQGCEADIITAGWPCQPHSVAGRRQGKSDERNLWPETMRVIRAVRPRYFLGENVPGIVSTMLDECIDDLEAENYEVWPMLVPAYLFGASHRRERLFIVAYDSGQRVEGLWTQGIKKPRALDAALLSIRHCDGQWKVEPDFRRIDDGLSNRMDRTPRLKALGNSVYVPLIEQIGRAIIASEGR